MIGNKRAVFSYVQNTNPIQYSTDTNNRAMLEVLLLKNALMCFVGTFNALTANTKGLKRHTHKVIHKHNMQISLFLYLRSATLPLSLSLLPLSSDVCIHPFDLLARYATLVEAAIATT